MEKQEWANIYLGKGEIGKIRKSMLYKLAEQSGFCYRGEPSIAQWMQAFLDSLIELESGISQTERKMTLAAQALLGLVGNEQDR